MMEHVAESGEHLQAVRKLTCAVLSRAGVLYVNLGMEMAKYLNM